MTDFEIFKAKDKLKEVLEEKKCDILTLASFGIKKELVSTVFSMKEFDRFCNELNLVSILDEWENKYYFTQRWS